MEKGRLSPSALKLISRVDDDDAESHTGWGGDDGVDMTGEDADGVGSKTRVDSILAAAWNMVSSTFYIFVTC